MRLSPLLACGALLLLPNVARAAGVTHSCVNPGGTGGCFATIRAAVDAGSSPLQVDVAAGTYVSSAAFAIERGVNVSVVGAGSGQTILDADLAPFGVDVAGGTLDLSGVTIRNANTGIRASGGGRVTSSDVEIVSCPGDGVSVDDGARVVAGGLRVSGAAHGVFASNGASVRISDGRFTGNGVGIEAQDSSVELSDTRVVRNTTGIDATVSKLVVRRSRVAGNDAAGIEVSGRLTSALISESSILNNGGPLSHGIGAQDVGRLRIERSTIAGNPGAGVIANPRGMAIVASTITGNGVGLSVSQRVDRRGKLTIDNSTIASNGIGLRCQSEWCGSFAGTIVADSTTSDCVGPVKTRGYNVFEDTSSCSVTLLATDLTGVDPKLGPLTDDGHLTDTKPLLPGSPAIDTVDGRFCRGSDQRGVRRGRPCDAGAYETASAP